MQPHRGTMVLILGILSLVCCGLLGPVAWIMGNGDLKAMKEGRMDPAGQGTTQAGMVCGIIGTILVVIVIIMYAIGGAAFFTFAHKLQ